MCPPKQAKSFGLWLSFSSYLLAKLLNFGFQSLFIEFMEVNA